MSEEKKNLFDPRRGADESFEQYKVRRRTAGVYTRQSLQGFLVWDGKKLGPYRKPEK